MQTSLLIIGNGVWGKKLSELFQKWDFKISRYGARDYLELSYEDKQQVSITDLIWIASYPDIQIQIVQEIMKLKIKGMIILEKPFFRNLKEQEEFNRMLETSNLSIRSSSPWVYSDIWLKSKDNILELNGPLKIEILRSGPFKRAQIESYLDWLSHDVQLLSDLFTFDTTIAEVQSQFNMQEPCTKKYTFKFSNGTLVELKGGASETRISIWRIQDLNGNSYAINFDSKTLESFSDREVLVNSYQSPQSDEPLLNMIQHYCRELENKESNIDFRWQEALIQ
jgi:predicted dehydrogenase